MMMDDERKGQPTLTDNEKINLADLSGQSPTVAATGRENSADMSPTIFEIPKPYSLSVRDVLARFDDAGLIRTERSIQRYCKDGKLISIFHPHQRTYYVTPESTSRLIGEFLQVGFRQGGPKAAVRPPTVGATIRETVAPHSDNRRDDPPDDATTENKTEEIQRLQQQVNSLEIDKKVRDGIIKGLEQRAREDREFFTSRIEKITQLATTYKSKIFALVAPDKAREAITDAETIELDDEAPVGAFKNDLER